MDRGRLLGIAEDAELDENGDVLGDGAQGADEPGEVGEEVFFLDGVEEDLRWTSGFPC